MIRSRSEGTKARVLTNGGYNSYLLDALSWSRLQAFIRRSRYSVPLGLLCSTKLRLRACDK